MRRIIPLILILSCLLTLFCGCGARETVLKWTDGRMTDSVYINKSLDMTFQIPEGWTNSLPAQQAASASDLSEAAGAGADGYSLLYDADFRDPDSEGRMFVARCDLSRMENGQKLSDEELVSETEALLRERHPSIFRLPSTSDCKLCGVSYICFALRSDTLAAQYYVHRLSNAELVIIGIFADTQKYLQYYIHHFTNDPKTLPNPPVSQPVKGHGKFARGTISGGMYNSEYLGLRFTPPKKWIYALDEELEELMGASFDIIGEDVYGDKTELAREAARRTVIYDMVSAAPNGSNVQIMLEKLSEIDGGLSLTAEDYAGIVCTQLQAITDYTYELSDSYTDYLAGTLYTVLDAHVADNDMQQQFWLLRVDDYMLCITFTNIDGSEINFKSCFSEIG